MTKSSDSILLKIIPKMEIVMSNVFVLRGITDISKKLFRIYKSNFLKLLAIVAIIEVPKTIIQFILVRYLNINDYLNNVYLNELFMLLIRIFNFVPYILMYGAIIFYIVSEQYAAMQFSIGFLVKTGTHYHLTQDLTSLKIILVSIPVVVLTLGEQPEFKPLW